MFWKLIYHPDVKAIDIPLLNQRLKSRIKKAIEERLAISPHKYGKPLRKTLKGYWKLRVGDYRIIFKIVKNEVWIFGIIHRRDVYKKIKRRL
ncbi:MAG: type II toxin-antitoxin system RelE family toxin [Candidatus Anammoxibacter sp.]